MRRLLEVLFPCSLDVAMAAVEWVRRRAEHRAWRKREAEVRRTWRRLAASNREFLERVA